MKKTIALVLCLILLSLAGCGRKDVVEEVGRSAQQDTTAQTEAPTQPPETEPVKTEPEETEPAMQVGEFIFFGSYEQDNDTENGMEPIEWIIAAANEEGYLLISRYVLDFMKYHETEEDVTWETCDIRAWLNGDFYEEHFTDEERERILLTTVDNSEEATDFFGSYSDVYGYKQSSDTEDYIYLLSEREMIATIPNGAVRNMIYEEPYATTYAYQKCLTWGSGLDIDTQMNDANGKCTCMTRTLTDNDTCIQNGKEKGMDSVYAMARGHQAYTYVYWEEYFGARPVLWISR